MKAYETLFICRQDISVSQVDSLADKYQEIITEDGGKMGRRENWGLKNLAYRIKKNRKGHIILFNYEAKSETVKEVERLMSLNEDILRYMTVKTEVLETEDSVRMKNIDERSSRKVS